MSLGEYIPNSNTKGLWHLNGNSNDSSGNSNNGTDTDITYSLANGKFGQGAGFNGTTSKIGVAKGILGGASAITISCWFTLASYPAKTSGGEGRTIYRDRTENVHVRVSYNQTLQDKGLEFVTTTNTGGNVKLIVGTNTYFALNTWFNIICVYDGTNMIAYKDGSPVGSIAQNGVITTGAGSDFIGIDGYALTLGHHGNIDEVIFENRAWTPSQIKKYYTNAKGRFGL
jgi:hypothetical protein